MRVHVYTIGCVLNKAESQKMEYLLKKSGFEIVDNIEKADVIIINTCTVKTPAENKVYRMLRKLKDKKVILTGCLVQHRKDLIDTIFKNYSIIGLYQIDRIAEAVKKTISGERVVLLDEKRINKLSIPCLDRYPIKIIPIQEGCLWNCSYCATKFARSIFQSFPPEDVYKEIKDAVKKGLKIIYLTGTDLACYGFDINTNLAELLKGIQNIDGLFFVRTGMINPGIANKYFDDLLKAFEDPRIFKFFHIPVQSGSNKVLKDMKRKYTIEEFLELVEKIRKKYPEAVIATDIIVGFPTETEEDFRKTKELIESVKFDVINISRFWPRPGTEAEKLKQLPSYIIKNRSREISKLFDKTARERNKDWIGWEGWCIVESKGTKENSWICRNFAYKQVIVKSNKNLLGRFVKVKVDDRTAVDLRGRIVSVKNEIDIEEWETTF